MSRSGEHYMPRRDHDFAVWQRQFAEVLTQNVGVWPVDGTLLSAYFDAQAAWGPALAESVTADAAARAATRAKDAARTRLEAATRPVVRQLQSLLEVTNADRANLGITVRGGPGPRAGSPTSAPLALVESPARLTHHLRLVDESTPTRRARPKGVLGAEVWVKLVEPGQPAPTDPAALTFLTMTTQTSFHAEFKPGEGGKTAVYMARWINTRGEKGPWSEVATATVAA